MTPDWIAVDWGTSACRAWAMGADGTVLAEARSDRGMGTLAPEAFEPALREMIAGWGLAPVLACGMVGARQGWIEAPYAPVPCAPDAFETVKAPVSDTDLSVSIIGGVSQAKPADVMRGEETQIAGVFATRPGFDGVLCLPGTHTKWVQVSAGEIVSFRTAMTGELFALLSKSSTLRHSIGPGWDDEIFAEAVTDALARPETLAARLFSVRADSLIHGLDPGAARARVSGLLIGAELAAMRAYWLGQPVALIGETGLNSVYSRALAVQGLVAESFQADELTRAGLGLIRARREIHA